ncbi:MAG: hypothetical protein Ct9H300mP28_28040 [Pseudomonadota bacterium]|nr:MAG: hypothetical protein Ct9H300mP28_28040 [Pseudomonadota bacterium]
MEKFSKGHTRSQKVLPKPLTMAGDNHRRGRSAAAIKNSGLSERITTSPQEGASLEFLEGKELPGVSEFVNQNNSSA